MWLLTTGGVAVNLDNCSYAEPGNTAGTALFHVTAGTSNTTLSVVFGSTEAHAIAGIAKVTQALDPAIYA